MRAVPTRILVFLLLVLAGVSSGAGVAPASAQGRPGDPGSAKERSDLVPDPAVRYETLPNGMTLAVMRNARPAKAVSFRFSIKAGSLNEAEDEQGLVHFIEHMAFNGSRSAPEGEMIARLERLGIAFGSDANAETGQGFTTFTLDLPAAEAAGVEECLFLLREIAGELVFDAAAVEREKGVVLAEIRRSDTFEQRRRDRELSFLVPGAYAASRLPLGKAGDVAAATPQKLEELYRRLYRPERATLVIVGDLDPEAMRTAAARWFSDWTGEGMASRDADLHYALAERRAEVLVSYERDGSDAISIYSLSPHAPAPDTQAGQHDRLLLAIGLAAVNRRLSVMAARANAPFRAARLFASDIVQSADYAAGSFAFVPGRWREGLAVLEQSWRSALQYGFDREEVAQELAALRTIFATAAQAEAARQTADLASQLVKSIEAGQTFLTPGYAHQLFEKWAPGITPDSVTAAFRRRMQRGAPLFVAWTTVDEPGLANAILSAWSASERVAVDMHEAAAPMPFVYTFFGQPGHIASDGPLAPFGARAIVFDNGVRLTLKRTSFQKGAVLVSLRAGNGAVALESAPFGLTQLMGAYVAGGLESHTVADLQGMFAGRAVQAVFSVFPDHFGGVYATRDADLKLQLQLAAAYMMHPGYRAEAETRWREAVMLGWPRFDADARAAFATQGTRLLASGDRRFGSSPDDGVVSRSFTELKAWLDAALKEAPIEIAIVGDFNEADAIEGVASTFGALPGRKEPGRAVGKPVNFVQPGPPIILQHRGEPSQALLKLYWPIDIDPDRNRQEIRTLGVLSAILQTRLIDTVREQLGASYSPGAGFSSSAVYPGLNYLFAEIEAQPFEIDRMHAAVGRVVEGLRAGNVTADELDRVRRPALEQLVQHADSNAYWLSILAEAQSAPDRAAARTLEATQAAMQAITPDDLRAAAVAWLDPANLREIDVVPAEDIAPE